MPNRYQDFRKLLDNKDIQAIVVCTPDHWHALLTIMACAAGKDVYVEKPLTLFVKEGRWMTEAARRYQRIVQVGTQQRSGPHYQKARELAQTAYFGKVLSAQHGRLPQRHARLRQPARRSRRRAISITTCGSAPRPCGPTIRTARSIISAGSGTIPAAR